MKTIGLLGGIGWESTEFFYRLLNTHVRKELGGNNSAKILLNSVNFHEVEKHRNAGNWDAVGDLLVEAGRNLKNGGADFITIANNSMHYVADRIIKEAGLELLHICDPTGARIKKDGHRKVALIGNHYTIEKKIYTSILAERYDISVILPERNECLELHRIIYHELLQGVTRLGSRCYVEALINKLRERGAEAIILGSSRISTILTQDSETIPIYDSVRLHADATAKHALSGSNP